MTLPSIAVVYPVGVQLLPSRALDALGTGLLDRACAQDWAIAQIAPRRLRMGRMDGNVAFLGGAARGQRTNHAVRLAQEVPT